MDITHKLSGKVILTVDSDTLSGAYLRGAYLREADLSGADLSGTDLSEADLSGADLRGAHLSEADLSGADLSRTDLSEADLSEADLRGAHLRTCVGNGEEIQTIIADGYTATWHKGRLSIGCETHEIDVWLSMSDIRIQEIGDLDLWRKWKPIFKALIQEEKNEMTQDNALDPTMPISKEALLAKIDVVLSLLPRYDSKAWDSCPDGCRLDVGWAATRLDELKRNIEDENNNIYYPGVVRKPDA